MKEEANSSSNKVDYRLFFKYAPDGVVLIDHHNLIRFWNPKAEVIFGWRSEEVLGKTLSAVIVPQQFREAHDNGMKRYLSTGEIRVLNKTIEVPALHRNGHEFFISLTISKIDVQEGTTFLAFIRDITEQRNNQAQLQQKTIELERSNIQLQEFASIASHDLKEPLRKIIMFSNIINSSDEVVSTKIQFHLQKIEDAAVRMRQLVDGILSYSVVETGGQKEWCSLESVFKEVLNNLESHIKDTHAIIVSDNLPNAEVIPLQIQQLFQNLISNALKFAKKDVAPYISITHNFISADDVNEAYLSKEGQYLEIKIKDNGIGFRMDAAENIFGLFKRLHSKSAYEGSGLGLAICRKIVENHGGSIAAYSEEGMGSTFSIILPYHKPI